MGADRRLPAARISIVWNAPEKNLRIGAFEGQVTPLFRVPVTIMIDGRSALCQSGRLPVGPASLGQLALENALEFAVDDAAVLQEAHRVLVPGGMLTIVVPNRSGFGALDVFNAFRYVCDVTKRGPALPEIAETGWRRHYAASEITSMLSDAGFAGIRCDARGVAGHELRIAGRLLRRLVSEDLGVAPGNAWQRGPCLPQALGARLHVVARKR